MKAGAILSYFSLFLTILIALIYTPIMIRLLGQAEFGLYTLIGSVALYFNVLDMGLGNAIVRYTARNRVLGNKKAESELNGIFIALYSIIGLITLVSGFMLVRNLDIIFGSTLSVVELEKAKIMLKILTFNFALSFPLAIFGSIMQAYEKFVIVKITNIVRTLLVPILTLPLLFMGFGSITMVVITTIVGMSCLIFNVYYCFKKIKINIHFGKIDLNLLKEIFAYSFFIFLNVIVDLIYWNTDQIVLGALVGTSTVAVYAIAMQFVTIFKMFSTSISNLFLPRASIMVANNSSNHKLTEMMIKYGRIQFVILSFVLFGFILYGYPFLILWAGENYSTSYYIVLIIMIPLLIPLIQNFGIAILQAKNHHKFRSLIYIFIAILNISISIPLASRFGGIGPAIATAASLFLGHILIMNVYYQNKIGLNIILFWKNIIILSLPGFFAFSIGLIMNYYILLENVFLLLIKIILFSTVFFLANWRFGFNEYEKNLLKPIIVKFFSISNNPKGMINK